MIEEKRRLAGGRHFKLGAAISSGTSGGPFVPRCATCANELRPVAKTSPMTDLMAAPRLRKVTGSLRLCSARWVIPVSEPPIREGAVRWWRGRAPVVAVGSRRSCAAHGRCPAEVRAAGALCPGLVNAHATWSCRPWPGAPPGATAWSVGARSLMAAVASRNRRRPPPPRRAPRSTPGPAARRRWVTSEWPSPVQALGHAGLRGRFFHELVGYTEARTGDALGSAAAERAAVALGRSAGRRRCRGRSPRALLRGPDLMRRSSRPPPLCAAPPTIHLAEDLRRGPAAARRRRRVAGGPESLGVAPRTWPYWSPTRIWRTWARSRDPASLRCWSTWCCATRTLAQRARRFRRDRCWCPPIEPAHRWSTTDVARAAGATVCHRDRDRQPGLGAQPVAVGELATLATRFPDVAHRSGWRRRPAGGRPRWVSTGWEPCRSASARASSTSSSTRATPGAIRSAPWSSIHPPWCNGSPRHDSPGAALHPTGRFRSGRRSWVSPCPRGARGSGPLEPDRDLRENGEVQPHDLRAPLRSGGRGAGIARRRPADRPPWESSRDGGARNSRKGFNRIVAVNRRPTPAPRPRFPARGVSLRGDWG